MDRSRRAISRGRTKVAERLTVRRTHDDLRPHQPIVDAAWAGRPLTMASRRAPLIARVDQPDLDLTVIVPARDAEETIDEQLRALACESMHADWEIIVVDNGSRDRTVAIVERWAREIPNLRLVDGTGVPGPAHARNVGAQAARGRNLAFCDAYDIVAYGWVAAMNTALDAHEFASGPVELTRLNPPWLVSAKGTTGTAGLVWFDDHFPFASSCNLGIRRERFLDIGGFDERLTVAEDVDLAMRLHLDGVALAYVPDAAVHYRYRQTRGALFTRAYAYGAGRPLISERLRTATGRGTSRFQGWRNWAWLIRNVGLLRTRTGQARWLWTAGTRVGALRGSLTARRLYL